MQPLAVSFLAEFKMVKFPRLLLSLFLVLATAATAQFAHTDHKQIVDGAGKPLLTRATNLGNWLVPEGYTWLFEGGPQSASEIHGSGVPKFVLDIQRSDE